MTPAVAAPDETPDRARLAGILQQTLEKPTIRDTSLSTESRLIWADVKRFYKNRGYYPAWTSCGGRFPLVEELFATVREAADYGLDPNHYPIDGLESAVLEGNDGDLRHCARLDLYLTHLFITYASHLAQGRLDPRDLETEWHHPRPRIDFAYELEEALAFGQIRASLHRLSPRQPAFEELRRALRTLREEAWPEVEGLFIAEEGRRLPGVAEVRGYLRAVGYLPLGPDSDPELMDAEVADAVRAFQLRHGLEPDGVVGPQTLDQMRVSARERVRIVELNMERQRWLGDVLPDEAVVVNIPEYKLRVYHEGEVLFRMNAITGAAKTQTPSFADEITYLELNPPWHIPESIATDELLPKIVEDPGYLASENIAVFDTGGAVVDPETVDWTAVRVDSLGYRFRQAPGVKNPLGTIKFMLPNRFSVYLHDTPNGQPFGEAMRAFSHGCVRLEHPLSLAAYLLRPNAYWTGHRIVEKIESGKQQWIDLPKPMPIFLVYFTAFVDDGKLDFRRDIYERDAAMTTALDEYVSPCLRVEELVAGLSSPLN